MSRPRLVMMARVPALGRVKTRLAADIGAEDALAFYRATLARLCAALKSAGDWDFCLAVTPDAGVDTPTPWPDAAVPRRPQGDGDLGVRLQRWLDTASHDSPVLVVGSDIPEMTADLVRAAWTALTAGPHEMLFAPASDGGFWAVGARRPPPRTVFDGVRWSSAHALADCLANLPQGAAVPSALTLDDIDTGADHARWRARVTS